MNTLRFSMAIEAPRETVWEIMLGDKTYREWTAAFCPGSYFEGTWREGSPIRFLAPDGNGIASVIAASRPPEFVSIRHLGLIRDGMEDMDSEQAKSWVPASENYRFLDTGAGTNVQVELDVPAEFEQYMLDTWPQALARLKDLCEAA